MARSRRATRPKPRKRVKLTPSLRLLGLGAILLVALTFCSANFSRRGELPFMGPLAVAAVAYLLAVREVWSGAGFLKRGGFFSLALAALLPVSVFRMPPGPDGGRRRSR